MGQTIGFPIQLEKRQVRIGDPAVIIPACWINHRPFVRRYFGHPFQAGRNVYDRTLFFRIVWAHLFESNSDLNLFIPIWGEALEFNTIPVNGCKDALLS
jgi:hypothetical protein